MIDGMHPLTIVCQRITEEKLGQGKFKPEWKQGHDQLEDRPILWTTIECKCGAQVYFDKQMRRHICSKCGEGF
jgi:hypothetical protein